MMEFKVTEQEKFVLIQVCNDGKPGGPDNPINIADLKTVTKPQVYGKGRLLVVSGVPMAAVVAVCVHYKNMFNAVSVFNPSGQQAIVTWSISPDYVPGQLNSDTGRVYRLLGSDVWSRCCNGKYC